MTRSSYRDHYQSHNEANNNSQSPLDTDFDPGQGDTWDSNRLTRPSGEDEISEVSASAANVANDGKHPLLEFAMRYFREGRDKFESLDNDPNGSLGKDKGKKAGKKKKSGASDTDWTWKDRIDMVKWTDRMINVRLMIDC